MKKRKYQKVNVSKLKGAELRAYKKRLASVRAYTRDKREWERKIRNKELNASFTLDQYRGAKHGHLKAQDRARPVLELKKTLPPLMSSRLQRLMSEIIRGEKGKTKLVEVLTRMGVAS